ncbi:hypothetical protein DN577_31050, partial [Burkholderia multivorans]
EIGVAARTAHLGSSAGTDRHRRRIRRVGPPAARAQRERQLFGGTALAAHAAVVHAARLRARRIWDRLPERIGIDGEFVVSGHLRLARSDADL